VWAGSGAFRRSAASRVLPYAITTVAVVVTGLPTIILPFWVDSSIFSFIGKTITEGGMPYTDAWDFKPPGIYLLYALAIQGPFDMMRNVRVFDLAWTVATSLTLVELGSHWWNRRAGVIAGLLYGVVYITSSGYWMLAQPDGWVGLPLMLAVLLYARGRGRVSFVVPAGILLGVAFQLRFIMALLIPFLPFLDLIGEGAAGRRPRLWVERLFWLGIGFSVVQIAILLYLVVGGALGEFIAATRFASGYTRTGGPWNSPDGPTFEDYLQTLRYAFWHWAGSRLILTLPALVAGVYGAFIARERHVQFLVILLVLAYAGIATQAKFFWYHFLYMVPMLALLAGWGWDRALSGLFRAQSRTAAVAVTAGLTAALLLVTPEVLDNGYKQWTSYTRYYTRPDDRDEFYGLFPAYVSADIIAAYVRERTAPGEPIYVWGFEPLIYLMADRPSPSRFIHSVPLVTDWSPPEWQREFMADLQANPPTYFITQHLAGGTWITGHNLTYFEYIATFTSLQAWMDANYDHEIDLAGATIYRRRG
jgi:hypothetical protein